jgi:hypothetical protein
MNERSRGWGVRLICGSLVLAAGAGGAFASAVDKTASAADRAASSDEIGEGEDDKALSGFLKSCGLRQGDIYFDRELVLHGKERARMVLASGKDTQYLAALSEEGGFVYVKMPWRARGDLRDARVLDLAGDGREALVFRYRERGSAGDTREVLGIWRVPSESHIRRVFAAEVGRSAGDRRIENSVRFLRRGRANDLVIEAGSAKGFSASNYSIETTSDRMPILLPWGDERRARYQFIGDQYRRSQ